MTLFFDTYAMIELVQKNPAYEPYLQEDIRTTLWNLGELYYYFVKHGKQREGNEWFAKLLPSVVDITPDAIQKAMLFKHQHRTKKMSMVDCIGYIISQKNKFRFLTGDSAFGNLPNVEFVR